MSTDVRPWLNDDQNHETLPGPGAYDLNFREELKTLGKIKVLMIALDQKYSQRYKKNPFGAKAPRFGYKKEEVKEKPNELSLEDEPVAKEQSIARKFIDETIEKMKQDEARKTSFQFKSSSKRFKEEHPKARFGN